MGPPALIIERQNWSSYLAADTLEQPMRGQAVSQRTLKVPRFPQAESQNVFASTIWTGFTSFPTDQGPSPRIWPCIPNYMAKFYSFDLVAPATMTSWTVMALMPPNHKKKDNYK